MAASTGNNPQDGLKSWLQLNGLLGDFARGGRSSATLRIFWNRHWAPGFDPNIPDWWVDHVGETQGQDIMANELGFAPGQITAALNQSSGKAGHP